MSMEMIFKFANGSRLDGDAQSVGSRLHHIRNAKGRLTAGDVVEDAKPKNSVLHEYFEWDDEVAAGKYRTDQARHLIRSIVVVEDEGDTPVRAFAKVRVDDENTYEPISVVMSNPRLRMQVLKEVSDQIEALKAKLAALEGFSDVLVELDKVDKIVAKKIKEEQAARV